MGQNLASVHFTPEQWTELDVAIGVVERLWEPMLVVLAGSRRRIAKMGDGSEPFCRGAYRVMRENPRIVPFDVDLGEWERDFVSHDELALRRMRIDRLVEKLTDTDIALGSDIMTAALRSYAQIKLGGQAAGLEGMRRDLGRRFEKGARRRREAEPATA